MGSRWTFMLTERTCPPPTKMLDARLTFALTCRHVVKSTDILSQSVSKCTDCKMCNSNLIQWVIKQRENDVCHNENPHRLWRPAVFCMSRWKGTRSEFMIQDLSFGEMRWHLSILEWSWFDMLTDSYIPITEVPAFFLLLLLKGQWLPTGSAVTCSEPSARKIVRDLDHRKVRQCPTTTTALKTITRNKIENSKLQKNFTINGVWGWSTSLFLGRNRFQVKKKRIVLVTSNNTGNEWNSCSAQMLHDAPARNIWYTVYRSVISVRVLPVMNTGWGELRGVEASIPPPTSIQGKEAKIQWYPSEWN